MAAQQKTNAKGTDALLLDYDCSQSARDRLCDNHNLQNRYTFKDNH